MDFKYMRIQGREQSWITKYPKGVFPGRTGQPRYDDHARGSCIIPQRRKKLDL